MEPIRPSMIIAALDTLAARADELSKVTTPTLFGGVVDRTGAQQLVQRALTDAEAAADMVARGDLGTEAERAARASVTMLEHASFDEIALRGTAQGLRRSVDTIRDSDVLRGLDVETLIATDPTQVSTEGWMRLGDLLDAGDVAELRNLPRQLDGAPAVRDVVERLASAPDDAGVATFERYRDAMRAQSTTISERRAELDRSLADITTPDPARIGRIGTLLDADATSPARALLDELTPDGSFAWLAHRVRTGATPPATALDILDERMFRASGPVTRYVDELLGRDPSELTPGQWTRLATVIDQADARQLRELPREIDGSMSFVDQAREIAAGKYRPSRHMQVYFDHYVVRRMAPAERTTAADALLTRDPATLTARDWSRLATLVESDSDATLIDVSRELEGAKPLAQQAREIAKGDYKPARFMQAYFDEYAAAKLSDTERAARADAFLTRTPDELSNEQWRELGALVDTDARARLIPVSREITGSLPLSEQARDIGAGKYRPSRHMHVYFDEYAVKRVTPAQRAAEADALLQRDPEALSSAEWRRLAALVDADDDELIKVSRELTGAKPLSEQAREIADGTYRPARFMHAYFDEYAVSRLSNTERSAQGHELLSMSPDELTSQEWRRLAALVDSDRDGMLIPVSREIAGAKPLSEQAREIADGKYRPARFMRVYFDEYAVARLSPAERVAAASDLLARSPADLTNEEWRHLAALVDSDAKGTLINVPREITGSKPLAQQAREIADGTYRPGKFMQVYFTHWQRLNDPAYQSRLEAALADVVAGRATAESRRLVAEQWDRLESVVAGRAPADQAAIAEVMLNVDDVAASRSVKSTLELLRSNLQPPSELPAQFTQLHANTVELIDRNLARLNGHTPAGAVQGYSNHPDYAEIGRIRANVSLLQDAQSMATARTSAPTAGAAETIDAASINATSATGAASPTESLDW
ncbi:MAG: hypothetical protein JWL76_2251 [Thermoleophilia bacterium]|nr:hypothetical protein [Thermoleophilia bacterium]